VHYIEEALNTIEDFGSISVKIFVSKQQNTQTRIYMGALIKNMLREYWDSNQKLSGQKKV